MYIKPKTQKQEMWLTINISPIMMKNAPHINEVEEYDTLANPILISIIKEAYELSSE